jgi:O-antigen/teichoic acid export membrane protein
LTDREYLKARTLETTQMSSNRILIRNGVISGLQIALTGLGLLGAYRIISLKLGVATLGAWAICLSIASLTSLFDGGASDALVRQIAQSVARGDHDSAGRLFSTAILMCIVGSSIGAAVLFFSVGFFVSRLVAPHSQSSFSNFFGYALVVGALNVSGNACIGVLEGLERYDLKLGLSFAGIVIFFIATAVLVPVFGSSGMIASFAIQAAFTIVVGIPLATSKIAVFRNNNWRPSAHCAAELVRIGFPLKAFGLASFAIEPLTRMLVGSFGGMRAAGTYEVAARAVGQLRGLIVGIAQVSLPRFVSLTVSNRNQAVEAEALSIRVTGAIALSAFGSLIVLLPWLSQLLIGNLDREMSRYAFVLSFGWFINTLCAPYFYATVAAAHFRTIWASTILMATVNAIAGYLLALHFGALGAVFGLSIAVTLGSTYIIGSRITRLGRSRFPYGLPEIILASATVLMLLANATFSYRSTDDQVLQRSAFSFLVLLVVILSNLMWLYLNLKKRSLK